MKVIDFWVIFGSKKLKNYFYFCFGCDNGTGYTNVVLNNTLTNKSLRPTQTRRCTWEADTYLESLPPHRDQEALSLAVHPNIVERRSSFESVDFCLLTFEDSSHSAPVTSGTKLWAIGRQKPTWPGPRPCHEAVGILKFLRDALHLEARLICYQNLNMWLNKRLKSSLVIGQKVEIVQSASRCKASLRAAFCQFHLSLGLEFGKSLFL